MTTALTIGITTRNRPDALRRCLASIDVVLGSSPEVLVFDDASDVPASQQVPAAAFIANEPDVPPSVGYLLRRRHIRGVVEHEHLGRPAQHGVD